MTTAARPDEQDTHDRALLAAHVEGDPQAFGELVRRNRQRMWAVALRTLGDPEEAADAVQDACISAFRSAGSFRGDARVTTWLHRIVVNACLDRARSNPRPIRATRWQSGRPASRCNAR
jgi:RNA polymerase sigma-70 factor (ECF subfamily)